LSVSFRHLLSVRPGPQEQSDDQGCYDAQRHVRRDRGGDTGQDRSGGLGAKGVDAPAGDGGHDRDSHTVAVGRRNEVLAWNRLGHLLLAGHLDFDAPGRPADRPNLTRMLFLDPHMYRNWREEASLAVASMRFIAAQFKDDRNPAELIG
jgi:hypothetical protein